jgi:hypothetical protein
MIEKRKAPRAVTSYSVFFMCLNEDGRETTQDVATILNISDSGLLLETSVPILTKEIKIMASLKNRKTVQVTAELIYSMQLAPNTVRSGLSFKGDSDHIRRFVAGIVETS